MTIDEAIKHFEQYIDNAYYTEKHQRACEMAISALRAQQTPAKLDKSQWAAHPVIKRRPYRSECFKEVKLSEEGEVLYRKIVTIHENWTDDYCSDCGKKLCSRFTNYCPNCGRALTEEAWAELERRRINDGTTDVQR